MTDGTTHTSFRRKLLIHVGVSVGMVFLLTFLLLWMGSTIWFKVDAERFLRDEAESIAGYVVRAGGVLNTDAYTWNEPHHLFADPRIDPVFVQIFDRHRREVFATENIGRYATGAWPGYLIQDESDAFSPASELETRFIGTSQLYFFTYPLRSVDGELVGYLQAARHIPDIEGQVVRILWIAGIILLLLLGGLLLSLHVRAGRLLQPLQAIARTTDQVSARKLDVRLPEDDSMDKESHILSQSFNRLLDRLDASFTDMRRFTSNAAHQLQTPLTVMKGHVDVTLRKERDATSYRETLELMRDEITEMTHMVKGLLRLSRLHGQEGDVEMVSFLLSDVVERVRNLHAVDMSRLQCEVPGGIRVRGHLEWVQLILENLVDNALKYAPEGTIRVAAQTRGDNVIITVQDQGPGLAEEDREHLAERFYRGRNAREAGVRGHGLGLALVDRLVFLQDGDWSMDSNTSGTCVTVRLSAG